VRWIDDAGNALTEETPDEARSGLQTYLYDNMMPYDIPIARTLGFPRPPPSADAVTIISQRNIARAAVEFDNSIVIDDPTTPTQTTNTKVDGLSDGILNSTLYYSLQAKALYPWTDLIPKSIYMEYVVPYAIVNEPRVDHRPLLFDKLHDPLSKYTRSPTDTATKTNDIQISDMKTAIKIINTRLWSLVGKRDRGGHSQPIVFVAGQTPRIYDPLSVVAYGHSSCTGLAILLIAAFRAVGIPSRMAGTPAWHGKDEDGNHSWVEVYIPSSNDKGKGQWMFLEPSPGIQEADTETANADDIDRDPKKRWFCTPDHFDGKTKVYATKFAKKGNDYSSQQRHYPMAWSDPIMDVGVPGEDRTAYYMSICGDPPPPPPEKPAAPKPN
jgi:transglutaminase-like putative cysteine protease